MSLDQYAGEWNSHFASHLLRRTSFSTKKSQINTAITDGLEATVSKILTLKSTTDLPINPYFTEDPDVAIGESWVEAPYYAGIPGFVAYRNRSLAGWVVKKMMEDSISIQEKMTLFWHNHFVVSDVNDARFIYRNYALMRNNALGDFKQLVKDVTIDPSMLRYLNGKENTKQAPNENYARELLELFTIGKGDIVGEGDYTTFTEHDVVEIAKVLTGWIDRGHNNPNGIPVGVEFVPNRHDTTTKTLSIRFDNAEITNQGEDEYKALIDIIFQQEEVSRNIVRDVYRWFVNTKITDEIETDIITPLGTILRDNDYVISSVLDVLLKSEHFYEECNIGTMIKSPMDFILNSFSLFDTDGFVADLEKQNTLWFGILQVSALLQQTVYNHPTVAGWKAYYQEPVFDKVWLNSVTLPLRSQVTAVLWAFGIQIAPGEFYKLEAFKVLDYVSDPSDINILVTEVANSIFPKNINTGQRDFLKNVVLGGLPDFEWNVEYTEYLANPDDENIKLAIENKLRLLFINMCYLPEYHLS